MQTRRDFLAAGSMAMGTALLSSQALAAQAKVNRRIVLAQQPKGEPTPADFRLEEQPISV